MRRLTARAADALWAGRQALDTRLDPAATGALVVCLSGGGDSLALLRLVRDWARPRGRPVLALTVDHRLQAASAAHTAFAGAAAAALGVPWRSLPWTGPKPTTGRPAAARRARHALLAAAAREAGARVLLLGHTADDRLEEEIMRLETPGLGRLREWAPSPAWPDGRGLFLLRPLLNVRRDALRRELAGAGLTWLEDPANDDPAHARARARARLAQGPPAVAPPVADPPGPCGAGDARFGAEGWIALPMSRLAGADGARLMAMALTCVAGAPAPPRTRTLAPALRRLLEEGAAGAALGGALVSLCGGSALFYRDPGAQRRIATAPLVLEDGEEGVFDGRFEVVARRALTAFPLFGRIKALDPDERARIKGFSPAVRAALPALLEAGSGPRLPEPWGRGPGRARSLAAFRFRAAAGLITSEREIFGALMAHDGLSSYLHSQARD